MQIISECSGDYGDTIDANLWAADIELACNMVGALNMQELADGYLQNLETNLRKLQVVRNEMIESWLRQEMAWPTKVLDQ